MAIGDLFRPKHKHSKPEVRAQAIAEMGQDDLALLQEIASTDRDLEIRRAAVEKIRDPEVLREIAGAQEDAGMRSAVLGMASEIWVSKACNSEESEAQASFQQVVSLNDEGALAEIAGNAKLAQIRQQALERVTDPKALLQVVRKSARADEWQGALQRITDLQCLRSIAIDEKRKEVAFAALDRIEDAEILQEVASKAKSKPVRSRAKRNKKALEKDDAPISQTSAEEKRARAERAQLAREMKSLAAGNEWIKSRAAVDEAKARFAELGDGEDADLAKKFHKQVARYEAQFAKYGEMARKREEELAKKKAEEERAAERAEQKKAAAAEEKKVEAEQGEDNDSAPEKNEAKKDREAEQNDRRLDNQDQLEQICEKLEELAKSDQMKGIDSALKSTERRARKLTQLPKSVEEELRARYEKARQEAVIRLGELREADEWKRWASVPKMEALIERAKALLAAEAAEAEKSLGDALKGLQAEWKELGPTPREKGEELWATFKATCDEIYEKVKEERSARSEEQKANYEAKLKLVERAEELQDSTDWQETSAILKGLQEEWKTIGPVPRRKSDSLWKRFRAACDAFFEARAPHLEEKISEESDNLEAKMALIESAEKLAATEVESDEDISAQISEVKDLQSQWRDIGFVPQRNVGEVNERFKAACDAVYGKRAAKREEERERELATVAEIEKEISAVSDAGWDSDAAEIAQTVLRVRERFLALPTSVPGYAELEGTVQTMIRGQLDTEPDAYKGTALDPEKSAAAKEKIIAQVEELLPEETPDAANAEEVAEKLRSALEDRALGGVLSKLGNRSADEWRKQFRAQWAETGYVPGAAGKKLTERFEGGLARLG